LSLDKGPQVLALLNLCCQHLHLVTATHVVPVSSKALGLGGSVIAISLVWTFADV